MKSLLFNQATGRNVLLFLGLYITMVAFVMAPAQHFMESRTGGVGPLDLQLFYGTGHALNMLGHYDAEVRAFYRDVECGADIVYPVVYTLLLGLFWLFLLKKTTALDHALRRLWWVPFIGIFFDYAENICIVHLLDQAPVFNYKTLEATVAFSGLKWSCFLCSLVLLVTGLLRWAVIALQKRTQVFAI